MSDLSSRMDELRAAADPSAAAALDALLRDGEDRALNRVNVLEFADQHGLRTERVIGAFLHASRLGLFDMSWNLLCPGCGGVLDANATLKTVEQRDYPCALCGAGYQPDLDEMVEVSFTVNPRVRRIAAHDPDTLPMREYQRQVFWSSGVRLPEGGRLDELMGKILLDHVELAPGQQATRLVELPKQFTIVFDPVSHVAQFIDVQGERTAEARHIEVILGDDRARTEVLKAAPGPLRVTIANRTRRRALPGIYVAGDDLHEMLGHRKPFLTAKQILSNQTFRDIYRADTLAVDQKLKITSLTFLFTDLKGSTALYDRVGDLVAFDLVKSHFRALQGSVAAESGAVVKTIGDAVMATFPTPARAMAAALRMREAMRGLAGPSEQGELTLKIGLHEGPCLAVMLNDQLDYFGQTVNVAARVQALATSRSIFATEPVILNAGAASLLAERDLRPHAKEHSLKGVSQTYKVYEIP